MKKVSRKYFEYFKQKHYELWDWLSKNPDKIKGDWFNSIYYVGTPKINIRNNCFACELAQQIRKYDSNKPICEYCPICKGIGSCLDGLFNEYAEATNNLERMELAKQIRDLPWSEEYVEDEEMNNENYIVINGKKAELTEEQLRQLGIEVDKDKRWRAEEGKKYWRVSSGNKVISDIEADIEQDDYFYDTHNYFKTKEEAEEYAEVLEIKGQLMKFADEHNEFVNWSDATTSKYHLEYRLDLGGIVVVSACWLKYPEVIYFSSKEIAKQAIDTIGEENIIKYLTYNY